MGQEDGWACDDVVEETWCLLVGFDVVGEQVEVKKGHKNVEKTSRTQMD